MESKRIQEPDFGYNQYSMTDLNVPDPDELTQFQMRARQNIAHNKTNLSHSAERNANTSNYAANTSSLTNKSNYQQTRPQTY